VTTITVIYHSETYIGIAVSGVTQIKEEGTPMKKHMSLLAGLLVFASLFSTTATASTTVYEDVGFLAGFEYGTDPFEITDAGLYQATLTDFEYPAGFDYLSLAVTSSTDMFGFIELTGGITSGMFTFYADPGIYFASIIGDTSGSLGLYGVDITAVPEPSTWLMLMIGILLMGYHLRKEQA
jgi:hypothetical protein